MGAGAIVLVAIIGLFTPLKPERVLPVMVQTHNAPIYPNKSLRPIKCVKLKVPTLLCDEVENPGNRCPKPPKIEIVTESDNPLKEDAIYARCGKPRIYHDSVLPCVKKEHMSWEQSNGGCVLIGQLSTGLAMRELYSQTPHGIYNTVFAYGEPGGDSKEIGFNYVYKEDFKRFKYAITPKTNGFGNISGNSGGLEIKNHRNRCMSADLNQNFDFKTNFYIRGYFTLEFDKASGVNGLEIALCDKWGEKVSVVIPDGGLNNFSIKMKDEDRSKKGVMVRSDKIRVIKSTKENTIYNYFEIRIWENAGKNLCSLYVQPKYPNLGAESLVHERVMNPGKFEGEFTRIKLRVWKTGVVKLYDFEIGELAEE